MTQKSDLKKPKIAIVRRTKLETAQKYARIWASPSGRFYIPKRNQGGRVRVEEAGWGWVLHTEMLPSVDPHSNRETGLAAKKPKEHRSREEGTRQMTWGPSWNWGSLARGKVQALRTEKEQWWAS